MLKKLVPAAFMDYQPASTSAMDPHEGKNATRSLPLLMVSFCFFSVPDTIGQLLSATERDEHVYSPLKRAINAMSCLLRNRALDIEVSRSSAPKIDDERLDFPLPSSGSQRHFKFPSIVFAADLHFLREPRKVKCEPSPERAFPAKVF